MNDVTIERIWEDVDFYEISIAVNGLDINLNMPTYVNNEMMIELANGMNQVGVGEVDEFHWESGKDIENVTFYASIRTYKFNKLGKMCIEFILDNKSKKP